jgi:hypothetical protein
LRNPRKQQADTGDAVHFREPCPARPARAPPGKATNPAAMEADLIAHDPG